MVRRFSKCTHIDRPIRKETSTIQRFAYGPSACSYHFVIAQKTIAVNNEDIA